METSRKSPPITSGLAINGTRGNFSIPINVVKGSSIVFRVDENRTAPIDIKVYIQQADPVTDRAAVTDNTVLSIATGRGAGGAGHATPLGGPEVWNYLRTALFDTKADDLTILPFESDFTMSWRGLVNGQQLQETTYNLCVSAKDLDGNFSPGPSATRTDTCQSILIDHTPPTVTLLDANSNPVTTKNDGSGTYLSLSKNVSLSALDTTNNGTVGSGIDKIFVFGPSFSSDTDHPDGVAFPQDGGQTAVLGLSSYQMANGDYIAKTFDRAGNFTQTHFVVNSTGPVVTVSEEQPGAAYTSVWQGPGTETLYTPGTRLGFAIDSQFGSPLASFTLSRDGVEVLSKTYTQGETFTEEFYFSDPLAVIPSGTYTFEAKNQGGESTTGTIERYTMSVDIDKATTVSALDPTGRFFQIRPNFNVVDKGPDAPTGVMIYASATGKPFEFVPVPSGASQVLTPAPLPPGIYYAVLADINGQAEQGFDLQLNHAIISDNFTGATLTNTQISVSSGGGVVIDRAVSLAVDPTDVISPGPNGEPFPNHLFYAQGDVLSQIYDLQAPGAPNPGPPISFLPPDSIAAALEFKPGQTANLGFNVTETGFDFTSAVEPGGVPTGMSMTWYVRTSDDSGSLGSGNYTRLGERDISFSAGLNTEGVHDLLYTDVNVLQSPVLLKRYAQIDVALTRSSVKYRSDPPGGASPQINGLFWHPTMTTLRVFQSPEGIFNATSDDGNCGITAPVGGLTCAPNPVPPPLVAGYEPGAGAYKVDPPVIRLGTQGTLSLAISTSMVIANSLDPNSLAIYEARPGQPFARLPSQIIDPVKGAVVAFLSQVQLDSTYQIFGTTKAYASAPVPPSGTHAVQSASDSLTVAWSAGPNRPYTSYAVFYATVPSQPLCDDTNALYYSTTTSDVSIALSGLQPGQSYMVLVCNPAVGGGNGCDTPIQVPTVAAGGAPVQNPDFVSCANSQGGSPSALGLSADPSGRLWEVLDDGQGNLGVGLFDVNGVGISSTPLPSASGNLSWEFAFDASGGAYAVGAASGPATAALDLEVAKLSPSGGLAGVAVRDGGYGLNDIPLDATATASGIWITGAVQTAGGQDLNPGAPGFAAKMALWRYDFSSGLLTQAASYSGPGGIDLGLSVAPAADGGLWVVGLSSRPETPAPAKLALALWRFDSSAQLLFGPVLVPGYMKDIDRVGGRLAVSSGVVTAALARYNGAGNTDLAVARFSAADGRVLSQKGWHGAAGAGDAPAALAISPSGNIVIAGGSGPSNNDSLALWTYGADGGFLSAQTMNAVGGAKGLAYNANGLWLAAGQNAAPLLFSGGAALPGAEGFEGGPIDFLPPRTTVAFGAPSFSSGTIFISSHTLGNYSAVDDASLIGDGIGAGVAQTYESVDGGAYQAAVASFTAAIPGAHRLAYYSVDAKGQAESIQVSTVVIDMMPPATTLLIDGIPSASTSRVFFTTDTIGFVAVDTEAGVSQTLYALDASTPAVFASTFTLLPGMHTIYFQSLDRVGNMEALKSASIAVLSAAIPAGAAPPVTTLAISTPSFGASPVYVSSTTSFALSASDGSGPGVARTLYAVDAATFTTYAGTFTLVAQGTHTIRFYSVDALGVAEVARSMAVAVDAAPPFTALGLLGGRQAPGTAGVFVSSDARVTFTAADPIVNGVASGVAFTRWRDNGGVFQNFVSSFALAEGSHILTYQSQDNVGNQEVLSSTAILVDATPPSSTATIGAPLYVAADGTNYVTPATPVTLSATDPIVNGAASGIDHIEIAVDSAPFAAYVSTLTFAEGRHTVQYRAVDRVGNVEAAQTLRLQSDNTAPVTAFQASAAYFAAAGRNYAPLSFAYSLPAQDPIVNGVASGLAVTMFRTDASSFTRYVSTFSLTEGVRRVDFQSADNVGNQELLKSATVYVDATPPLTALTIGQPQYGAPGGTLFVGPAASFALAAQDPIVQDVASGVNAVSVRVDSGAFSFYSTTFTLTPGDGLRAVSWFATDNVGNTETPKVSTVALDSTPPLTSLLVSGGRQFPGPDAATFYASSDTRLVLVSTDPLAGGVASGVAYTRWQDNGGTFQTYLSSVTFAEGAHRFGYQSADNVANLEILHSTNIWIDATPPVATIAIGSPTFTAADGTIYVATATPVTFAAADPNLPTGQPGSGLNRIEISLDGASFTPYTVAITLAEGRHVILYRAVDNVGNVESAHSISIQSDATPPVSALVIGAPQFQLPNVLLVSTRTPFSIAVVDPATNNVASGVKDTSFRVSDVSPSTAAFAAYAAPFAMAGADVNKVVEFFSRDNVLNTEITKSSTVLLDSTPPEIALLSPAACDSGICRVLKGRFPVLGTARDLHFGNYQLEFAAGQNAASGFSLINSSTAAVSSNTLAVWDATALAGWFTLRLTATDLVLNGASVAINVFVGDPGELLTLGNHEVFNMPEGVAAGADGKIYVADRENDRIAVFSSTGALLASFGVQGHDDDDHRLSTGTLRLHEPSGVAVDADGSIYVADTGHDRVLKLSATGQVLLTLGRREHEQEGPHDDRVEDHDRRLPGRFHEPAGVAVDSAHNIFVADTDNRRVQVFNSTGGFSFQFDLPPVPVRPERDDDDRHGDQDDDAGVAVLGKPFAVALDAAGNIYVADPRGGRALKFGATGQLLLTIPITGDASGSWGRPFGVAVSASGDCLLVSDRKYSRILKFDFQGSQNLAFGTKGRIRDDDAPAPSGTLVFKKPMGLALDGQGNLFVADRNNDRVRQFGLPTGQPPLVVPPPKPEDDHSSRDVVDKEDGGKVERKDLAAVDIPAGAVVRDMKVTVSTPTAGAADASSRQHAVDAAQLKTASPPVEYGPEGTKFASPVTLTLPYSPDLVALQGVDEADLTVRYWNRDKSQWENLDSTVDPKTHTVKAKTTHFSLYQVFSGTATAGPRPLAVGDPTFTFHDAYAFPNPVRGVGAVTIRMQPGLADSVEVRVYDLAGRKVYSSSNFSLNTGLDDGNGKGFQYTYDHVWDISGAGSGVYQYVITAKKSGQTDIHKAGRIGVVK